MFVKYCTTFFAGIWLLFITDIAHAQQPLPDKIAASKAKDWQTYRQASKPNSKMAVYFRALTSSELEAINSDKTNSQSKANSKLIEIKSELTVKSSIAGFLLFLQDYDKIPNWLDNANGSQLIEQVTPSHNIFRTQFSAIWPVSPREMLIESQYWQDRQGNVHIKVEDASDHYTSHKNHIAISIIRAHWLIKPIANDKLYIQYRVIANANGKVPSWLANKVALRSSWRTLKNINQQLPNSDWQYQKLANILEYQELIQEPTSGTNEQTKDTMPSNSAELN